MNINKSVTLTLTFSELCFIHQTFNEVCCGLFVQNFNLRIGRIEDVKKVMQIFSNVYENAEDKASGMVQLELSFENTKICEKVVGVVCEEIEEWEFQSRIGETRERAIEIKAEFQKILDE